MSFLEMGIGGGAAELLVGGLTWSVRIAILLTAIWLLTTALSRVPAAMRHRIWVAAMAAALVLPPIRMVSPWHWDIIPVAGLTAPPAQRLRDTADRQRGTAPATMSDTRDDPALAMGGEARPLAFPAPADGRAAAILLLWTAGSLATLASLAWGTLLVAALSRRAAPPAAGDLQPRVWALAARLGVRRRVRIFESPEISVPLTHGIFRPEILLPAGAVGGWSEGRLDAVLLHELAHVRRHDVEAHVLSRVLCALHWFNPLAWVAARHLAREGERACDDHVLLAGTRASSYAGHLLDFITAGRSAVPAAAAVCMARKSELEGRIVALLDPATPQGPSRWRLGAMGTAGALGSALLVSVTGTGAGGGSTSDPRDPPPALAQAVTRPTRWAGPSTKRCCGS